MPVKRRTAKRRFSAFTELEAWACAFDCEYDFFSVLPEIGVETDELDRPPREVALEAWRRLGRLHLQNPNVGSGRCWALEEFGEPEHAN